MKGEGRRRKEFKIGDKVMVKKLGLKRKAFETKYDLLLQIYLMELRMRSKTLLEESLEDTKATNISQNKCVSEDVYSHTSLASERCINTPKIFVRPKRNHKPVERYGFVL